MVPYSVARGEECCGSEYSQWYCTECTHLVPSTRSRDTYPLEYGGWF